ncbi:hypothetical protein C3747_74g137 [Trypanosoma cruzi]|uniref:Zeta toxin domain-containing protein n=2 Tax=Trypanosoma cruzi TaxID=5693 RepID=Q4DS57_TRYCC|nr:hypothetical protein, conserved [Trypanosoma cruzi]EAN95367.1 hypothetical protein, conserved [Trypanosoma cruzi]PWV09893.1 hypothetical protein C3747_74g137 [Trypanosoma cruzi]|eukprot:XP_817218.1 hypothetical protein [Trypanosoma cruzi strain CL Brener]
MEAVGSTVETAEASDEAFNSPESHVWNPGDLKGSGCHATSVSCAYFARHPLCNGQHPIASKNMLSPFSSFWGLHVAVPFLVVLPQENAELSSKEVHQGVKTATVDGAAIDAGTMSSPFSVPPERFLTWHEMCKILVLCGVKRHHCHEAVRQLWEYLLFLCYKGLFESDSTERGNYGGRDTTQVTDSHTCKPSGAAEDFATLVRYDTLNDVLRSHIYSGGATDKSTVVCFAELVVAASVALGNRDLGQLEEVMQAPSLSTRYTLVTAKHTFDRCIARLLINELRGQRITMIPLPRWNVTQAIVQNRRSLIVFCGGTSGCGKSTLSSLITTNICFNTLLSTDTIRQSLRRTLRREEFPELFLSTYEAHRAKGSGGNTKPRAGEERNECDPQVVIAAYEKQCEVVLRALDGILEKFICRNQVVFVEGVHLLTSYMQRKTVELQARGVLCVSFLVCITKEERHLERFRTRAKCMALSPQRNKYVSQFHHIRLIQKHLLEQAYDHLHLKIINNTNLDKSLMDVHTHLLDAIDCSTSPSWNETEAAAFGRADATRNAVASDADMHGRLAPKEEAGKSKEANCGFLHQPFADPNISGKRMLAFLLKWRSEKKRRRANNTSFYGKFHHTCHVATSLFAPAKRARSAESLTSFRLQSLCLASCSGNTSDELLVRAWRNNDTQCFYVCDSDKAMAVVDSDGYERPRWKCSPSISSGPAFPIPRHKLFQKHPQEATHAVSRKDCSLEALTAAEDPPAATVTATAAASRWGKSLRSSSADAAIEAVEGNRAAVRGNKQKRFLPRLSSPRHAAHGARGNGEKIKEEITLWDEKEEEMENGSRCEFPSLMGS